MILLRFGIRVVGSDMVGSGFWNFRVLMGGGGGGGGGGGNVRLERFE